MKFTVFFFKDWQKKKDKNEYNRLQRQQQRSKSFLKNSINPIEMKIENDTVKNMIEKCKKKKQAKFTLEGLLFSSSVQNNTEKKLYYNYGLLDAK